MILIIIISNIKLFNLLGKIKDLKDEIDYELYLDKPGC